MEQRRRSLDDGRSSIQDEVKENKMKRIALALLIAVLIWPAVRAQTGTAHGILVTWNAVVPGVDPNAIAGYNIYQCAGNCTSGGLWSKVDTSLDASTSYLVPYTGLTAGSTYSYTSTAVDSNGNESPFSNTATVTLPTVLPVNPGSPTGCTAKAQ
jgi:fibronectin type 3 domain-containing protein